VEFSGGTRLTVRAAPSGRHFAAWAQSCLEALTLYSCAHSELGLSWRAATAPRPGAHTSAAVTRSLSFATSPRAGTIPTAATCRTRGGCMVTHTAGRRHGRRSGDSWSGCVAPATKPGRIRAAPRMSRGWVPGAAAVHSGVVRAGEWRNWRRPEPVLPCDCDLRLSFPSRSPEPSALRYARMVVGRGVMEDPSIHWVRRRGSLLSWRRLLTCSGGERRS
jgi:hypothetical protein